MFVELYRHQEWADAVVWRAVTASDAASNDKRVRDLLAHLHMTQHAFFARWTEGEFKYRDAASFTTAREVLDYARDYHSSVHTFVDGVRVEMLETPMPMPWAARFKKDPVVTTLRETLMQVPMHSTYHRGQANARLRELGVDPPLTDYIAWIWLGRPQPAWPS